MNRWSVKLKFALLRTGFALASRFAPQATGRAVARRFVTPMPRSRIRAREVMVELQDGSQQFLCIQKYQIATYVFGDPSSQPYVLLCHGWSSYGLSFVGWIAQLREMGFAVVAFDQLAHGLSSGDQSSMVHFIDILREMGRHYGRPAALVGHSLGASSAMFAVEQHWMPNCFVMIAPFRAAKHGALRLFDRLAVSNKAFASFEKWIFHFTGKRFDDYDAARVIPSIDRPALIVHDRNDMEIPWEEGAFIANAWKGSRLFTTLNLGHFLIQKDKNVISEAISFVRQCNCKIDTKKN